MKVNAVSLTLFRSQDKQTQGNTDNKNINPYVYTTSSEKKKFRPNSFRIFLGTLATLAVGVTLYKLSGKKLFK